MNSNKHTIAPFLKIHGEINMNVNNHTVVPFFLFFLFKESQE